MNQYHEKYYEMAKEFNLKQLGFICSLPYVNPIDFIMKFDNMRKVIYIAKKLEDSGKYISCYGSTELRPKRARQQLAKLMRQYKEILVKRKLKTIEKDFK